MSDRNGNPHAPAAPVSSEPQLAGPEFRQALDARREPLAAMPEDRVLRNLTLDVTTVSILVLAVATKLRAFRDQIVAQFGAEAGVLVDLLRTMALAVRQAETEERAAVEASDLSPLHKAAMTSYNLLVTDADSLVNRGFIPAERLANARSLMGYQATIDSLLLVVEVLRQHWPTIAGHTPLTTADVDAGERAARVLSEAIAHRDHRALRSPATELRVRALSDVVRTYDEVERMMTFIRWHHRDIEELMPSLYATRSKRSSVEEERPEAPATPGPVPTPVNGGAPFTE